MKVRDLMKSHPNVAFAGQTLHKVGGIMADVECGVLPVLGADDVVVGIVTDRDVCLALSRRDAKPSEVPVEQVMTTEVLSCEPDAEIEAALGLMREHRVRRLPVVDAEGHLKGLLSFDDVALAAHEDGTDPVEGPLYADVARTLQAINRHDLPAITVATI